MRSLRVIHAAGTGDVIGTFRCWLRGDVDLSEVAFTYSEQFYDVCRDLGATAWVISTHARRETVKEDQFTVEHRPIPFSSRSGLLFHIGMIWNSLRLIISAVRFRADVVVAMHGVYWFSLAILAWMGVQVVPSLHCAFWAAGHRPQGPRWRLTYLLDGWFWRHFPMSTIAVSPECERQVRELTKTVQGRVFQVRAQYRLGVFDAASLPPDERRPFRILYAGRIARMKGVFDLLEMARQLENRSPGTYRWELCGSGPDEEKLHRDVVDAGLEAVFKLRGRLNQADMVAEFSRCHVVVVPTNRLFGEGLNKVSVEGVLAGRVVVTSRLSNAVDVLGDAVVEVPPDDVAGYVSAVNLLASDRNFYERKRSATEVARAQFYDHSLSWGSALRTILVDCAALLGIDVEPGVQETRATAGRSNREITASDECASALTKAY